MNVTSYSSVLWMISRKIICLKKLNWDEILDVKYQDIQQKLKEATHEYMWILFYL